MTCLSEGRSDHIGPLFLSSGASNELPVPNNCCIVGYATIQIDFCQTDVEKYFLRSMLLQVDVEVAQKCVGKGNRITCSLIEVVK